MHRQASIDGLVVTAFMRSRLKAAPMNRGTTNHATCHSKIDEALPVQGWAFVQFHFLTLLGVRRHDSI